MVLVDLLEISKVLNLDELEKIRVKLLGKNGIITQKFKELKNYSAEEKKIIAKELNELKEKALALISEKKKELEEKQLVEQLKKDK